MKLTRLPARIGRFEPTRLKPLPKRADPELLTPEHQRFRATVIARAGGRCEWVEAGERCTISEAGGHRMIADHIVERADGGAPFDPANGQCLCTAHNTLKGVRARAARLARTEGRGGGSNP